jgi:hypothetical protein
MLSASPVVLDQAWYLKLWISRSVGRHYQPLVSITTAELPLVQFHDSHWSFPRTQAFISILECNILLLDNNLALHAFVPETAGMATLKGISARCLSQELNHGRFSLLELPTLLCRTEN